MDCWNYLLLPYSGSKPLVGFKEKCETNNSSSGMNEAAERL